MFIELEVIYGKKIDNVCKKSGRLNFILFCFFFGFNMINSFFF